MWGRRDSGDSTEHATRRQSALTRDLQSLSSSAPDHAGAMAGAAMATSHTRTPDADSDHHSAERTGAVPIRQPSAGAQAASLQLGGNVTHYAPNSLHLGAYRAALSSPVASEAQSAVCLAAPADFFECSTLKCPHLSARARARHLAAHRLLFQQGQEPGGSGAVGGSAIPSTTRRH